MFLSMMLATFVSVPCKQCLSSYRKCLLATVAGKEFNPNMEDQQLACKADLFYCSKENRCQK